MKITIGSTSITITDGLQKTEILLNKQVGLDQIGAKGISLLYQKGHEGFYFINWNRLTTINGSAKTTLGALYTLLTNAVNNSTRSRVVLDFTATAGQTVFNLGVDVPADENDYDVLYDYVLQDPALYSKTAAQVVTLAAGVSLGTIVRFVIYTS